MRGRGAIIVPPTLLKPRSVELFDYILTLRKILTICVIFRRVFVPSTSSYWRKKLFWELNAHCPSRYEKRLLPWSAFVLTEHSCFDESWFWLAKTCIFKWASLYIGTHAIDLHFKFAITTKKSSTRYRRCIKCAAWTNYCRGKSMVAFFKNS